MKEKNLKLIMELIFIFILPLAFILPNVKINNVYIYDSSGNFETSEKVLSFITPFSYIKEDEYINILDYNQLVDITNYFDSDIVINDDNTLSLTKENTTDNELYVRLSNIFDLSSNHKYFFYVVPNIFVDANVGLQVYLSSPLNNYPHLNVSLGNYRFLVINNSSDAYIGLQIPPNSSFDFTFKVLLIDLTQMFGVGFEPSTIDELELYIDFSKPNYYILSKEMFYYSDNIVSSNYAVNYTVWGKIKILFTNFLDIGESAVFDLFMAYLVLWSLMFIVWHLVYTSFDFIVHLFKIRKRE